MNTERPRRLLYVDDEPDIRTIANISLAQLGHYDVRVCASGQEALDTVSDYDPDLILLDVMMPGLDGPMTLKRFREMRKMDDVPIVFVTARAQKDEVKSYFEIGAYAVIPKPYDPLELPEQVAEIWRAYRSDGVH
jgi:two-component system, OmpR family, response regulator